ncbi:MAG TPA: class I SAM-dependent methyltransferase [Anaerolineales bacterium]|nr:class I SAM-dependent methyltransferase [Anaerolineales bacterium]
MQDTNKSFNFEDHFSQQSKIYAQYRPQYPEEVYGYLASIAPGRSLAWDCGTGNGQAAIGLAKYFDRIHATDASADQIAVAYPHDRVDYRVEPAEHVSLRDSSVDLVTVAVAIHWFNFDEFYREVKRVLKPEGVLAAWTYNSVQISPEIDPWVDRYYGEILKGYWPERIRYIEERYETIPFPFEEVEPPFFVMEINWNLIQFAGFLNSWSATQRYKAQHGQHPLENIWPALLAAWGNEKEPRLIRWPLYFRIGKNRPSI